MSCLEMFHSCVRPLNFPLSTTATFFPCLASVEARKMPKVPARPYFDTCGCWQAAHGHPEVYAVPL